MNEITELTGATENISKYFGESITYFNELQLNNNIAMGNEIINPQQPDVCDYINVLNAVPGCGKTTTIGAVIRYCIDKKVPILLMSDRCERLESTVEDIMEEFPDQIINLSPTKENRCVQGGFFGKSEIMSKLVVVLATQKYNKSSEKMQDAYFKYDDGSTAVPSFRSFCIIDEAISDYEVVVLSMKDIGEFKGNLHKYVTPEMQMHRAFDLMSIIEDDVRKVLFVGDSQPVIDILRAPEDSRQHLKSGIEQLKKIFQTGFEKETVYEKKCALKSILNNIDALIKTRTHEIAGQELSILKNDIPQTEGSIHRDDLQSAVEIVNHLLDIYMPIYAWMELDDIWADISKDVVVVKGNARYETIRNIYFGHTVICYDKRKEKSDHFENGCRYFMTVLDHLHKLPYHQVPIYIMDGTGDIDNRYADREIFKLIDYKRPEMNLELHIHDERTGKAFLSHLTHACADQKNQTYADLLFAKLPKIIQSKSHYFSPRDCMVAGYKQFYKLMEILCQNGISNYKPASFGNITGRNDFRDCSVIAQIGVLVINARTAFLTATSRRPDIWEKVKKLPDDDRINLLTSIGEYVSQEEEDNNSENTRTDETINETEPANEVKKLQIEISEICENVKISQMMVDTVQEIFRTRIRNWDGDKITVILLISCRSKERRKNNPRLNERYVDQLSEYFGVQEIYHYRTINPTCTEKIKTWLSGLKCGEIFTMQDIADQTGEKKETVQKAMKRAEQNGDFWIWWYLKIDKNSEDYQKYLQEYKAKSKPKIIKKPDLFIRTV